MKLRIHANTLRLRLSQREVAVLKNEGRLEERAAAGTSSGFGIDILKSAKLGDVLTATAAETSLAGRTGLYDITVTNQRGDLIAVFRGRSHRLGERRVFDEGTA